jgi:hypothetical protein
VVIRSLITSYPDEKYGAGGALYSFNSFNKFISDKINEERSSDNNTYIYACAGGSIINRKKLLLILNNDNFMDRITDWIFENRKEHTKELFANDAFISFLLLCHGYNIHDWDQYTEIEMDDFMDQYRLVFAPIVHRFKHFYDD